MAVESASLGAWSPVSRVRELPRRRHAVRVLQVFAFAVMVIPSDTVLRPVGAGGYPAGLVGMFSCCAWGAAALLGLHDPRRYRSPVRGALLPIWIATLASYVLMDRGLLTDHEIMAGDRWLMQLLAMTGVALVAAECLESMRDVRRVVRVLVWGGGFAGLVAALQFWLRLDISPYLRMLPGFSLNADNSGIIARAALNRVSGTAIHPIELGVVSGMLLPLAIWLALWDRDRVARKRWAPVVLILVAIASSVSRSAILSVTLAMAVLIVCMPPRQRLYAIAGVPFAVVGAFMSAHGLISTLADFFAAGTNDASVASRVSDYPLVERLVALHPWFGQGGGTYIADNAIDILDNEYLKTAIELGLVGFAAVLVLFLVPVIAAFIARAHTRDPERRLLLSALAGSAVSATACAFTFDAFSFPMFANVFALVLGLIGAAWRLTADEVAARRTPPHPAAMEARPPLTHLLGD